MTQGRRIDLHVHSRWSPDGRATVDELVEAAGRARLDGFALTDHNSVAGHPRLAALAREHPALVLLPGVETSTREGHLLAYGLGEAPPAGRPADETVAWVLAHGGVPVVAHPFRHVHGVGESVARRLPVSAIEVVNGHNGRAQNARALAIATERPLGRTGGSDAHRREEVGRAWTRFSLAATAPEELLEELRRGSTVGEGQAASPLYRGQLALRSFALRFRRGLRPL
jgi:predicted metal-dependent phosphoesterase TrpH